MKTILITGAAGFIGSSLSRYLVNRNITTIGIDNFVDNYNPHFKKQNLKDLTNKKNFIFYEENILDRNKIQEIFKKHTPETVIHLAGLTGVRKSIAEPEKYQEVNIRGTKNIFELALLNKSRSFIFASSSSVYGSSEKIPFSEKQILHPTSPYAISKYEGELYIKKKQLNSQINTTILRFFSVYGPHGRPDMAPYLFTEAAYKNNSITQYGNGNSARDFTYIDDVISAITLVLSARHHFEIFNIGNSSPVKLSMLIQTVESITGKHINKKIVPRNEIESYITYADISHAKKLLGWEPKIPFEKGMKTFIKWYQKNRL